jgi:hypothetical protein
LVDLKKREKKHPLIGGLFYSRIHLQLTIRRKRNLAKRYLRGREHLVLEELAKTILFLKNETQIALLLRMGNER